MADAIARQNVQRGDFPTLLDSQGWYTKGALGRWSWWYAASVKPPRSFKLVKTIDPDAFMSVASVMGAYGRLPGDQQTP